MKLRTSHALALSLVLFVFIVAIITYEVVTDGVVPGDVPLIIAAFVTMTFLAFVSFRNPSSRLQRWAAGTVAGIGSISLALIGYAIAAEYWSGVSNAIATSEAARWLRCRGVSRPSLAEANGAWTLTYSWNGGFGPGDVAFTMTGTGAAHLNARRADAPQPFEATYKLSKAEVERIARAVDESGLLCQDTEPRVGYRVTDLGDFKITVESGEYRKTLTIGECESIPDGAAFFEWMEVLETREPPLHESLGWGPHGTFSAPNQGACVKSE